MARPEYDNETIRDLVKGNLSWEETRDIITSKKDADRFETYIEVKQDLVPWDDPILLPIGEHLYIVQNEDGSRPVKCDCGYEFCEYTQNWKMDAVVYVRDDTESLQKLYPERMSCDPEWMVLREYYCPECAAQLEVEAVAPGYPIVFDFLPDLETFYNEWLDRELPGPDQATA